MTRLLVACAATLWFASQAQSAVYLGPTPYGSFADSPFQPLAFSYLHLEDFEDGALNTPGVTASLGIVIGPNMQTDSVDGDDGVLDGSGAGGSSFFTSNLGNAVTFTFNPGALGNLPNHVGVVWTDVGNTTSGPLGMANVLFEAFDLAGTSLGVLNTGVLGDGDTFGQTAEDRFLGVVHVGGISSFTIRLPNSIDWEIDHLQYGFLVSATAVPEPASAATWAMLLGLAGLACRRWRFRQRLRLDK